MKKPNPSISETFLALIRELNALGLDFSMHRITSSFGEQDQIKNQEKDIFQEIETKLQLRNLLARKRTEQFTQIMREEARRDKKIEKENNPDRDASEKARTQVPGESGVARRYRFRGDQGKNPQTVFPARAIPERRRALCTAWRRPHASTPGIAATAT